MINVICATYNQSKELEETIKSFNEQGNVKKRLIIIDGGSTDGFDEAIAAYSSSIDYFKSEADRGISDAFNKGVAQCEPGYVYFLGSGDRFINSESLYNLVQDCDADKDLLVCGKIRRKDFDSGEITGVQPKSLSFSKRSLLFRMSLPHQGLLTSTKYFEEYGNFREDCRFAMDYDILLRAYKSFPAVTMKDVIVADWISGGIGAGRTLEVLAEYNRIKRENKVASLPFLIYVDKWSRFKLLIKKLLLLG